MPEKIRSRKYQLTINNPTEKGFTHTRINEIMLELMWSYYCLCDEIGESGTYHTHLFFYCENAVTFERVKKLFSAAHIEKALGSASENRDYIRKEGKYLNSDKKETNIPETFEEYGEIPQEKNEKNKIISERVIEMIDEGATDSQIIRAFPSYGTKVNQLKALRQELLADKYDKEWRDLTITYIWGDTGTGKTRYVMEKYGYTNVCKVNNYQHPFDGYSGQPVLLLDEFRSSIPITDFLQYLDGYPCRLSARYADKVACYTEVYIVSNIPLDKQYPNKQIEEKESYNAFLRRISRSFKFEKNEINSSSPIMIEEYPESYRL